jgi:hypothetical protein
MGTPCSSVYFPLFCPIIRSTFIAILDMLVHFASSPEEFYNQVDWGRGQEQSGMREIRGADVVGKREAET